MRPSFIGDGLKCYRIPEICQQVSQIRGLTTAYTPYQPERSQGTLTSLWIYASALAKLTGFEVINASLYDRASGLYEALVTARKTQGRGGGHRALICGHLYPTDREVLKSYVAGTSLDLEFFEADPATGLCSPTRLAQVLDQSEGLFAVLYPQVNALGLLEDVDALTDLAQARKLQTIAIIDPLLLATGGLKAPSEFGHRGQGSDFIVGEGQHLCLPPSFGGRGWASSALATLGEINLPCATPLVVWWGRARTWRADLVKSSSWPLGNSISAGNLPPAIFALTNPLWPPWPERVCWPEATGGSTKCWRLPASGPVRLLGN